MGSGAQNLILLTSNPSLELRLTKDLEKHFSLHIARSGQGALKLLRDNLKAAIVMDQSIEDFKFDAFIDKVRNNPITRSTVFIIVSREGSNAFVHRAVRAGVAHYIGIPYEPSVLIEKIKIALNPKSRANARIYFEIPTSIPTQAFSFGRISYISSTGIHFETRLKLSLGDQIDFSSPLSEGIGELSLKVKITGVSDDCFYNYSLAYDAEWIDPKIAQKVKSWISSHRSMNSPKKAKVLCVGLQVSEEEALIRSINQNQYSLRFIEDIESAVENIPFLRPSGLLITSEQWNATPKMMQKKFLAEISKSGVPLIARGNSNNADEPTGAFECPPSTEGMALAINERILPKPSEPDRLYFSKALEDSRLKLMMEAKVLIMGELGLKIALEHELTPPANLHLDLKTFTEQDLRNPYVRLWPPKLNLAPNESEQGKFKAAFRCHFLGINDSQGQAIQKWLRDSELKSKRDKIHVVPLTKAEGQAALAEAKAKADAELAKKAPPKGKGPKAS